MAQVVRDIELRPHIGVRADGRVDTFAQDQIFLNGVRVGYIGHQPGTAATMIRQVDAGTADEIRLAIEAKFGAKPSAILTAPVIEDRNEDGGDDE